MAAFLLALLAPPGSAAASTAVLLDIKGPIGPATAEYVEQGLADAATRNAALVVLRMDTPGGLDTSMRAIIKAIIASPVPVASFVPSGGRAASAGTYILYASHIAAMAPGANLGAATPVQIGGGSSPLPIPDIGKSKEKGEKKESAPAAKKKPGMEEKILNDSVAYIRSLAELHGRNAEWATKAVTEAASLPAGEALKQKVIDVLADNVADLLRKIDGRTVTVRGKPVVLKVADATLSTYEPGWRTEFLSIITNPSVAYILLMIGVYGLIFEFYSPGGFAPGVIGGICLLLGLYALQLLPINYAGLALTVLGIALVIAETFVPSFGALGVGGIAAFVIGSIILLDTRAPGFGVSWVLIGTIAGTGATLILITGLLMARSHRRAVVSGPEEMIGSQGTVVEWSDGSGRIRVHSEMWRARAAEPLQPGTAVRVTEMDGLTLVVEPQTNGR